MHDVFVSYAHVDNKFAPGIVSAGWVSALLDLLKIKLASELGRDSDFEVWSDEKLLGYQPVPAQIHEAVRASNHLLIILSNGYLGSSWCCNELTTFLDCHDHDHGAVSRVFVVERDEAAHTSRPEPLKELLGYEFWERKGSRYQTLGDPLPTPPNEHKEYYNALRRLALELAEKIKASAPTTEEQRPGGPVLEVRPHEQIQRPERRLEIQGILGRILRFLAGCRVIKQIKASASTTVVQRPQGILSVPINELSKRPPEVKRQPAVFLAWTTDDLSKVRREVQQYLRENDVRVLPEIRYPLNREGYEAAFRRDIAQARAFVQLVSDELGFCPPDVPKGFPELQLSLARNTAIHLLRWRRSDIVLDQVELDVRSLLEEDGMYVETLQNFKDRVVTVAKQQDEAPSKKQPTHMLPVFLNFEEADGPLAQEIRRTLSERWQIGTTLPVMGETYKAKKEDLEKALVSHDTMLCVYGQSSRTWVRSQLFETKRVLPLRIDLRKSDFTMLAVYQDESTPPKPGLELDWPNLKVLGWSKKVKPEHFEVFVKVLQGKADNWR